MRGGHKKKSGPRRNRGEHREKKERRMKRSGDAIPIHMSASDRRHMKEHGEEHPIHTLDDDPRDNVKRKKIDLTIPSRNPPFSRKKHVPDPAPKQQQESDSEVDEVAEPNSSYSSLLASIKPRGRFADILRKVNKADSEEEQELEEEEEEEMEEENEDDDSDNSEEESEQDEEELEEGESAESEINSEEDGESEEQSGDESGTEDEAAGEPPLKEDEQEGQLRNAVMHQHFDFVLTDRSAEKFQKFIKSVVDNKTAAAQTQLSSTNLGSISILQGYGSYQKTISDIPNATSTKLLRPNLRWWARSDNKTPKPSADIVQVDFTPLQSELFCYLDSYKDLYLPQWTQGTAQEIRETYVIHALNHALKCRTIVQKNDDKAKAARVEERDFDVQDQGFTRPRVLIVVPYRFCAHRIVNMMISLLVDPNGTKVERFQDEFGVDPEEEPPTNDLLSQQFDGNADDCFRVGLTLNRSTLNLYTKLNFSDIIIASPLGLRLMMGADDAEGDAEGEAKHKKADIDFLSSIEIVIFDQTDCLLMQNWAHVQHLVESFNQLPKAQHETDISRIRRWCLDGHSRFLRQTILISEFPAPEFNALFSRHCKNIFGKVTCNRQVEGVICQVVRTVPQVFQRFHCDELAGQSHQRLEFFLEEVLPKFSDDMHKHTLIVIPSYFDFVRLRNHFRKEKLSFAQICEYTTPPNVVRARSYFFHAQRHYLLYTERFHYHHRISVRGIRHVVWYGLPHFASFYAELLNSMVADTDISCTVIYNKFDALRLEQVIGTDRAAEILRSDKATHLYM